MNFCYSFDFTPFSYYYFSLTVFHKKYFFFCCLSFDLHFLFFCKFMNAKIASSVNIMTIEIIGNIFFTFITNLLLFGTPHLSCFSVPHKFIYIYTFSSIPSSHFYRNPSDIQYKFRPCMCLS